MSDERKPVVCPWCGWDMVAREGQDIFHGKYNVYVCDGCEATSPIAYSEDTAYLAATRTPAVDENTSDGYHTFKELYHHRAVLFAALIAQMPEKAWKSKQHSDRTMYDGMFIVGIETPDGPATYHYDTDPYWSMFGCKELDRAPEWDGHTPEQAIERISKLTATQPNLPLTREQVEVMDDLDEVWAVEKQTGKVALLEARGIKAMFVQGGVTEIVNVCLFSVKPSAADIEAARKERSADTQ